MSLLTARGLTKTYRNGDVGVQAVKGADLVIEPASFVAFVGPSGSGKSTLLNMIGCLGHPTVVRYPGLHSVGTLIANTDDYSFSLVPEALYTGFKNLELRLRLALNTGNVSIEYGEKPVRSRVELRARYFFKRSMI